MNRTSSRRLLVALLLATSLLASPARADEVDNGVFRFLTQSLAEGTTNSEYVAQLIVVNADGPVTFSADVLPGGMTLDAQTGILTGRPDATFNQDVTFTADDGVAPIQFVINFKINASGGGGNDGSTVTNTSLAVGRVGEAYSETISVENGVGPYLFGAVALPPGLSMDGATGELSGAPVVAGTFLTRLTVVDQGEDNKVVTILPLKVLPASSDFAFTTSTLNNGEVGTPFCDTWTTSGAVGNVTYAASGLPQGLSVDASTGAVSGTPTEAGTYNVLLSATDNQVTLTTYLTMVIAPSPSSSFYWSYFGVPAAMDGLAYTRQPPIVVATQNGTGVSYSASGLPDGISYNVNTGELSGTATEVGDYACTFTATDGASSEVLELRLDFLVLPAGGGDANAIPVNAWIDRQRYRSGKPGKDRWVGTLIYNADRRTGAAFDPQGEGLQLELGARVVDVAPGGLQGTPAKLVSKSEKGVAPVEVVTLSPRKQTLKWVVKKATLTDTAPGTFRQLTTLGARTWRLDAFFDAKGDFQASTGLRRTAFIVEQAKLAAGAPGEDSLKLTLRLGDPAFQFDEVDGELRLRVLQDDLVLLDRDFSELAQYSASTHKVSGAITHKLKSDKDEAETDRVKRFRWASNTGKATLIMEAADLGALDEGEAHVTVELSVGAKTYFTGVTIFEAKPGQYTTVMP